MTVFQDSDGCLMDFDRQVFMFFGKYPDEIQSDDVMWDMIDERADEFWGTMPLKFGAMELWNTVCELSPEPPVILTGCPKRHFDVAAAHKVAKAKEHFGEDVPIITCLSRNKPLHMRKPGDILIDDMSRNIRRWVKAGGRGIHYRTWEQAIADFKELIATPVEIIT